MRWWSAKHNLTLESCNATQRNASLGKGQTLRHPIAIALQGACHWRDWRETKTRDPMPTHDAALLHAISTFVVPDGDGTPDSSSGRRAAKYSRDKSKRAVARGHSTATTAPLSAVALRARPAARHERPKPRPVVGVESPTVSCFADHCMHRSIILAWVVVRRRPATRRSSRLNEEQGGEGSCCHARFSSDEQGTTRRRQQKGTLNTGIEETNDRPLFRQVHGLN